MRRNLNKSSGGRRILCTPRTGVPGSLIPSTGENGASYLYNDLSLPADNDVEVRGYVTSPPDLPGWFAHKDGSWEHDPEAVPGSYPFTYQLYAFNQPVGAPVTSYIVITGGDLTSDISEAAALAAVQAAQAAFLASLTDGASLADSQAVQAALSASIQEAAPASATSSVVLGILLAAEEGASLAADQAVSLAGGDFAASIEEPASAASTQSAQYAATAAITEDATAAASQNGTATGDYEGSVLEISTAGDAAVPQLAVGASLTEPAAADSAHAAQAALSAAQQEDATAAATQALVFGASPALAETATLDSTQASAASLGGTITEAASAADSASSTSPGNYAGFASESASLDSVATQATGLAASQQDAASLAAALSIEGQYFPLIVEALALDTTQANQAALTAVINEAISAGATAASSWARIVDLLETLVLLDAVNGAASDYVPRADFSRDVSTVTRLAVAVHLAIHAQSVHTQRNSPAVAITRESGSVGRT